jgi:hypothetical protein
VVLNGIEVILHHPHHSNEFTKQDIKGLREYLTNAGVTPAQYAAERAQVNDEGSQMAKYASLKPYQLATGSKFSHIAPAKRGGLTVVGSPKGCQG